jgi:hypothetical protein
VKKYDLHQKIIFAKGFLLFLSAFKKKKFSLLSLLFFSYALAWSLYFQTINWFFTDRFHYTIGQLSLFIAFIGVVFALTTSIVSKYILKPFSSDRQAFLFFILIMAIANAGSAISHSETAQWVWVVINAMCDMLCYTVSLNIFSNLVDKKSQGWIMGVTSSIGSITWTVSGLIVGPLGFLNIHVPLWVASAMCIISLCLMQLFHKAHARESLAVRI